METKITYFEVQHGNGLIGNRGEYTFDYESSARKMINDFIDNPRIHNEEMTDDNVKYWKSQKYKIVKKTIITETIETINH